MNLYLMCVCDSPGPLMDSEKGLSELGQKQAAVMAAFLKRMIGRVDIVISSHFASAIETGEVMAKALGSYVATSTQLAPNFGPAEAYKEIARLAQQSADVLVIISENSLIGARDLLVEMPPGAIAATGMDDERLRWLVTPQIVTRDEAEEEVLEAARALVEASGEYTYDEVEQKRWVLGSGGASGQNCEICEENADRGWIDMDETFLDTDGDDIDDAPAHPNCDCSTEQKTRRVRVPV